MSNLWNSVPEFHLFFSLSTRINYINKYQPANMHPALHISIDVVYNFAPNRTSGGLYQSVTTSAEQHFTGIPNALAKPKSASFNSPFYNTIHI